MSIASEITRLQGAKANIKTSIENKGVTVSSNAKLDEYSTLIDSIPTGGDMSEYFNDTITYTKLQNNEFGWTYLVKKIPDVKIDSSLTNLSYCFSSFKYDIDFTEYENLDVSRVDDFSYMFSKCKGSSINISNFNFKSSGVKLGYMFEICPNLTSVTFPNTAIKVTNITALFSGCTSLQEIDLSMLYNTSKVAVRATFSGCTSLTKIDVRNLVFSNATDIYNPLLNVPTNCLIIVKDSTEKAWFNTQFPSYTNVKTASEYEANQ